VKGYNVVNTELYIILLVELGIVKYTKEQINAQHEQAELLKLVIVVLAGGLGKRAAALSEV
jgi:hypothetical protein